MYVPIRNSVIMFLFLLFLPGTGWADLMGQIGHFPTTSGSSWTFAGSGLTTDQSGNQVTQSFTETVTSNSGVFHSEIAFSGGNTTTSDNVYYQEDALYIGSTRIVIVSTTNIGVVVKTTTTTNNSYAPPQEFFPSELFAGNVETSGGICTSNITTVVEALGHSTSSSTSKTSSESIKITVAGEETITVGAGTFTAVKLSKELTVTEGGESYTTNITEWYAEGVGLVKMQSGYMNRDLVAYAVNPVEPSMFQISGNPGSFSTLQEALNSANTGNVIQMRDATITENLRLDHQADITLSGGWNNDYTTVTGMTKLHGALTLESGSMGVANLIIY